MDSVLVVLKKPVDIEDLKNFVTQRGGEWQEVEPTWLQAHFPQIEGGVFLRGIGSQENDVSFLSSEELGIAQSEIGIAGAVLSIDFSKKLGCRQSAKAIAQDLATKWEGVVLDEDG